MPDSEESRTTAGGRVSIARIDTNVARGIAASVPVALRPTWLARTWSGTFGEAGLRASVATVDNVISLTPRSISGNAAVTGRVHAPDASLAGLFGKSVMLDEHGALGVAHDSLQLTVQKSGFSKAFNAHAFERYADAGVDAVTLNAVEVGAYTWARQGFELVGTRRERASVLADVVRRAAADGRIDDAAFRALEPRLLAAGGDARLGRSTLSSIQELASRPEGRAILIGEDWHGLRRVEHADAWWAGLLPERRSASIEDAAAGSALVARRVAEQLPPALDPVRAGRVFERHLGRGASVVADSAETELRLGRRDQLTAASARLAVRAPGSDDPIEISVRMLRTRDLRGVEATDAGTVPPRVRAALDAAWRELGMEGARDVKRLGAAATASSRGSERRTRGV